MTSSLHSGGPLVVVEDVHLTLDSAAGPVNILRGISLEIAAGETVALVGPSGSGKSTLLMVLGGLERPTAGRVLIGGQDLGVLGEDALAHLRRNHIGIVFQAFHLIPTMTAVENVALPLEVGGRRDAFAVAGQGLEAVGLGHRLGHYPAQLSGGEQQRVAIARAFIARPTLLLADEPTGNLDAATGGLIIDCLFEQRARQDTTLLLITHDESLAERCTRRIRLADGTIAEDRTTALTPLGAARRAVSVASLGCTIRLARRELRGGIAGLRVLIACLVLGVAAIAGIGSLAAALTAGIAGDARELLGGDVEAQLAYRPANAAEQAFLAGSGTLSEVASLRAMARTTRGHRQSLIELKAVDGAYPLYGKVELSPAQNLTAALARRAGVFGAAVDPAILGRLDVGIGDTLKIGEATLQIRGTIEREPDAAASGLIFGPRVIISAAALAETRLIQPGALVTYRYRLRLPAGAAPAVWAKKARAAFPDAGWEVRSFGQASPDLRRLIDRVALFLSLVGMAALVVGGVGIGNAVRGHIAEKTVTIATLKCLGATSRLVFAIYLFEIVLLALVAILAALAIGALLPVAAAPLLAHLLPISARLGVYPKPLALAALYGLLTTLVFSLWPLAAIGRIPAGALFRDMVDRARRRIPHAALAATVLLTLCLAGVIVAGTQDRQVALWFVAGAIGAFALFWAAGAAIVFCASRLGRPRSPALRMALANLHRPGAPTRQIVLSLGIGLTVLAAVGLVEGNLGREIDDRLPAEAPAFFFIDIQPAQLAGFEKIVREIPAARMDEVPMMRGRITRLNGVPVETAAVAPAARWALRSDRGLTYSAELPKGSRLVAGTWWPPDYHGPPLISFDAALARGMGLKIGDTLTVNLLGREIIARIVNFRAIDWERLGINFVIVFAPGTLEGAPQTDLAAVYLPRAEEETLAGRVIEQFPNVSAIHVREALAAVSRVVGLIGGAVRLTALVTLAAGVLVLGGAIAAGHRRRVYDAVVLKVLGATRGMILSSFLIEHGLLGALAGVVAAGLGTLAAYFLVTQLMGAEWVFLPAPLLWMVVLAIAVSLTLGFAGTWRALGAKAAPFLRNE